MRDEYMELKGTCAQCERTYTIKVSMRGYGQWKSGTLIQDALPELSASERELLISGICGPCFDNLFGEDI